jgi:hypothetical protein
LKQGAEPMMSYARFNLSRKIFIQISSCGETADQISAYISSVALAGGSVALARAVQGMKCCGNEVFFEHNTIDLVFFWQWDEFCLKLAGYLILILTNANSSLIHSSTSIK